MLVYVPAANFDWNFSIRPAVSMYFSLPVKNGWQAEQISTFSSLLALRVLNVLPQLQVTTVVMYGGWMPSFMAWLSLRAACRRENRCFVRISKFIGHRR